MALHICWSSVPICSSIISLNVPSGMHLRITQFFSGNPMWHVILPRPIFYMPFGVSDESFYFCCIPCTVIILAFLLLDTFPWRNVCFSSSSSSSSTSSLQAPWAQCMISYLMPFQPVCLHLADNVTIFFCVVCASSSWPLLLCGPFVIPDTTVSSSILCIWPERVSFFSTILTLLYDLCYIDPSHYLPVLTFLTFCCHHMYKIYLKHFILPFVVVFLPQCLSVSAAYVLFSLSLWQNKDVYIYIYMLRRSSYAHLTHSVYLCNTYVYFQEAEMQQIPHSELTDLEAVGQGGYGVVYRASYERLGTIVYKELDAQKLSDKYAKVVLVECDSINFNIHSTLEKIEWYANAEKYSQWVKKTVPLYIDSCWPI